jgi:hypothetical protein
MATVVKAAARGGVRGLLAGSDQGVLARADGQLAAQASLRNTNSGSWTGVTEGCQETL